MEVIFQQYSAQIQYKFAVIFARYEHQWIFCRHKDRTTYECPGGHHEDGETIEETARRELYEETGALRYGLTEIGGYSVENDGEVNHGMLYFARVYELGQLPEMEIAEIQLFREFPEHWTYPEIQPVLIEKVMSVVNIDGE